MNEKIKGKALIAMSGGVDSSVAAYLMQEAGYRCIGVTMKLFHNEDVGLQPRHTCCSLDDVEDARSVAAQLGIPYYVMNFSEGFREAVLDPFAAAYGAGRTPNPCIDCNRYLKFEKLFQRAAELGCDKMVTGHYARIEKDQAAGRYLLKRGLDESKDQSYVLYAMTQEQLAHTCFPLGGIDKKEAREIAARQGFLNARKHDSQDLCFVPRDGYADFIESYTGKIYPPGEFVDGEGHVLGKHKGIIHYTIGQRKGLGLALPAPMYVKAIDPEGNRVVLGYEKELYSAQAAAEDVNLIAVSSMDRPMRLQVKIRYRQQAQWAWVEQVSEDRVEIRFETPQRAVTGGQAAVFYDGDVVVGGGTLV